MKIVGEIDLSGIKRIVINRTAVWERRDVAGMRDGHFHQIWWKLSGGPGDTGVLTDSKQRQPYTMMAHVRRLLSMGTTIEETRTTKRGTIEVEVVQILAYRCWQSGDTLNIVRKDLP